MHWGFFVFSCFLLVIALALLARARNDMYIDNLFGSFDWEPDVREYFIKDKSGRKLTGTTNKKNFVPTFGDDTVLKFQQEQIENNKIRLRLVQEPSLFAHVRYSSGNKYHLEIKQNATAETGVFRRFGSNIISEHISKNNYAGQSVGYEEDGKVEFRIGTTPKNKPKVFFSPPS